MPETIDCSSVPDFGRRETLFRALHRLHVLHPRPPCIVETGTLRDDRPGAAYGDGWSTLAWAWYAQQTGGHAWSVDIDPYGIAVCRRATADYATHLTCVCADSLAFFARPPATFQYDTEAPPEQIHLLYLDSFDYTDPERSEAHHLAEAEAALPLLAPTCLVLFDDTTPTGEITRGGATVFTGKGARAIPFLLEHGFCLEWALNGQVLLSRGAEIINHKGTKNTKTAVHHKDTTAQNGIADGETAGPSRLPVTLSSSLPPFGEVEAYFAAWAHAPATREERLALLGACPPNGLAVEVSATTSFPTMWLALRGVRAEAHCVDDRAAAYAQQAAHRLGASARFDCQRPAKRQSADAPSDIDTPRAALIHHHDLLHQMPAPQVRATLAHQLAHADRVVFSVPSVYADPATQPDDARLLPADEWLRLLDPFDVLQMRAYGDPRFGARERLLCILRGRPEDADLAQEFSTAEPYLPGITAIVHTRDEAHHIADCLQSLQGWTDEIIVCDMESHDATLAIARRFTPHLIRHPLVPNFDQARNVSAQRARYRWVFFLDADERVPPALGAALRRLVVEDTDPDFDALLIPFRHLFAGRWMQSLYPGYTAPRLFRNGRFHFRARPHAGAHVDGQIIAFPAGDPNLALIHFSYDSLSHYLQKCDRYTEREAANLDRDGHAFAWQRMAAGFVEDAQSYARLGALEKDGVHGLLYMLRGGLYRMETHARLYERHFRQ